jgi:hypothetical protein
MLLDRPAPAAAAFVAVALLAGPAWAESASEIAPAGRRNAVYVISGLATPVGFVGFEGVRRVGSVLEISGGLGAGFTAVRAKSGSPLQWSVMPRLRVRRGERSALTLGAGVSGGNIGEIPWWCDEYCDERPASYPTHYWMWANFEIGGEHWLVGGFAVRYFAGYARGCQLTSCTALGLPYIGAAFGAAF